MSALEQALRAIVREEVQAVLASSGGNVTPQGAQTQQLGQQQPQQTPAHDPFGGLGGQQTPTQRTPQEVQTLIMPHIGNAAMKDALSAEMQKLGVSDLGSARQDQLGPLYDAFSRVINAGGGQQPQQTLQQGGGII